MARIRIEGMEFYAYHGCYREEQVIGTRFTVDLLVEADTSKAEVSDHLRDTVNYQAMYALVKTEMEVKSHLLEHIAYRILDSVYAHHPEVTFAEVKVCKLNPALAHGGKVKQVSVTLSR
jgi:dihydroneopterin aldolase